jgi:hypothetical protein
MAVDNTLESPSDHLTLDDATAHVIARLNLHVVRSGVPLEGNLCYLHHHGDLSSALPYSVEKAPLRKNFIRLVRNASSLLEIGFNAGHSAAIALIANPALLYWAIDVGKNAYSRSCAAELRERFGCNFNVVFADSRIALASGALTRKFVPELIHVDGGHDFATARLDLLSVAMLCGPETLVLVDDCHSPGVAEALMTVLAQGLYEVVDDPDLFPVPEQVLLRLKRGRAPEEPCERRALLVAATDTLSQAEFQITGPSISAYAQRVGADLVYYTSSVEGRDAIFPKLAALESVAHYDRVLVLDTDIHVISDAPNLFELVPKNRPALYLESGGADRTLWSGIVERAMTSGAVIRRPLYANSGVMLLSRDFVQELAQARFRPCAVVHPRYEQAMVNAVLHERGFPVMNLSQMFNRIVVWGDEWEHLAWFHHYCGWCPANVQPWHWTRRIDDFGETRRVEPIGAGSFRTLPIAADISRRSGRWQRYFSASEFHKTDPGIDLWTDDGVHLSLNVGKGAQGWIFGPYVTLDPGRYTAEFLFAAPVRHLNSSVSISPAGNLDNKNVFEKNNVEFIQQSVEKESVIFEYDVTNDIVTDIQVNEVVVFSDSPIKSTRKGVITHEFFVENTISGVEFRVNVVGNEFCFFGVMLERDSH